MTSLPERQFQCASLRRRIHSFCTASEVRVTCSFEAAQLADMSSSCVPCSRQWQRHVAHLRLESSCMFASMLATSAMRCTRSVNDEAANPHRVLTLEWRADIDFHRRGREGPSAPLSCARQRPPTTWYRRRARHWHKVLADIHVAFMMNWNVVPWIPLASLPTRLTWQSTLGPGDAPCAHGDEVAVGEFIGFSSTE